uniref:Adaptor protein ClpS core domain-containing protein n=1 Tax=Compsopogon caeruleus TaxID=31354 RepID=A0A7S1TEG0_9RHOD|mmetsp:Transcript_2202/g.3800  ORF Transcript_2202/g.3800 Transcript_2202/m.3800 type:complete len:146 (+) Transcript_2202:117-554(+)
MVGFVSDVFISLNLEWSRVGVGVVNSRGKRKVYAVGEFPGSSPGRTSVLVPQKEKVQKESKEKKRSHGGGKYKVLILNDAFNSMEYVAATLLRLIPGMTTELAWKVMKEAHENGAAVVGVWVFELAEAYCDAIQSAGIGSRIEPE